MAVYPAPERSKSPGKATSTYSGALQDSLPYPDGADRGRQQQNQMTMPTMIGQPTMMNMAGGMPGNIQKPMANLNMEIILMNFWDMARGTGT